MAGATGIFVGNKVLIEVGDKVAVGRAVQILWPADLLLGALLPATQVSAAMAVWRSLGEIHIQGSDWRSPVEQEAVEHGVAGAGVHAVDYLRGGGMSAFAEGDYDPPPGAAPDSSSPAPPLPASPLGQPARRGICGKTGSRAQLIH